MSPKIPASSAMAYMLKEFTTVAIGTIVGQTRDSYFTCQTRETFDRATNALSEALLSVGVFKSAAEFDIRPSSVSTPGSFTGELKVNLHETPAEIKKRIEAGFKYCAQKSNYAWRSDFTLENRQEAPAEEPSVPMETRALSPA